MDISCLIFGIFTILCICGVTLWHSQYGFRRGFSGQVSGHVSNERKRGIGAWGLTVCWPISCNSLLYSSSFIWATYYKL